jgi:predicted  nucleic acid-binding Zn-ribbon protein
MISEVSAAYTGIKAAIDIAKGISSLKSETEINQAVIDIQRALLDAQSASLSEQGRISELLNKVAQLQIVIDKFDDWAKISGRYKLSKSEHGAYFYELREEFINDEIYHRICASCFEDKKRKILQTIAKDSTGEILKCPDCVQDLIIAPLRITIETFDSLRDMTGW